MWYKVRDAKKVGPLGDPAEDRPIPCHYYLKANAYDSKGDGCLFGHVYRMSSATHVGARLPNGDIVELAIKGRGTQSNGGAWTLTGTAHKPTLDPSIDTTHDADGNPRPDGWHGFLRDGEFQLA